MSAVHFGDTSATPISRELQQLWLQLVRSEWSSLVLIPTEPGTSARSVAGALVDMALFYDLGEFKIIDALGASLQDGVRLAKDLAAAVAKGSRVVVSVDAPMQNGGAMPLVMAAEAALLLVRLGASEVESTRSIIEIVGRARVIGAVALR